MLLPGSWWAFPLCHPADLAPLLLVPGKRVWGSVTIAGLSQTGWSHSPCHLPYLSGHPPDYTRPHLTVHRRGGRTFYDIFSLDCFFSPLP